MDVETRPVVQTGTPTGFLGSVKSEGMDEVEGAARGDAGPTDVSRVIGNLGLVQHDVEERGTEAHFLRALMYSSSAFRRARTPGSFSSMVSRGPVGSGASLVDHQRARPSLLIKM